MYINIGKQQEAKKFILQSIGRGVRIEPIKNKRKRLLQLYNSHEIDDSVFNAIKDNVIPLETLFIFGTNRKAIETVVKELETQKQPKYKKDGANINNAKKDKILTTGYSQIESAGISQIIFNISPTDYQLLTDFMTFMDDDRILLMMYDTDLKKLKSLRNSISGINDKIKFNVDSNIKSYKNVDVILRKYFYSMI